MNKCSIKGCNLPASTTINGKPYCPIHAQVFKSVKTEDNKIPMIHTLLVFYRDPLSSFIISTDGFREAHLPLVYSIKKEGEEGEVMTPEGINWYALVGAEPIDELKRDIDLVLAAEFAEKEGLVTAKKLAKYLASHPYSSMRGQPNEEKARELLNKLTEMGIVKKKSRAGRRGANIYDYYATEKSWRKTQ